MDRIFENYLKWHIFQIPNIFDQGTHDGIGAISLEDPFSAESQLSSSQPSPNVPDLLNSSMDTLQRMAASSNHDTLIFQD